MVHQYKREKEGIKREILPSSVKPKFHIILKLSTHFRLLKKVNLCFEKWPFSRVFRGYSSCVTILKNRIITYGAVFSNEGLLRGYEMVVEGKRGIARDRKLAASGLGWIGSFSFFF